MTVKRFRVFNFLDVDKFGVSDDVAEVTVAFCDTKWEADYLSDLLNELHEENERLKEYNNKLMKQALLFDVQTIPNTMKIIEANTKLEEENEQLKTQLQNTSDQRDEFHRGARENANRVGKLEKENEQLKSDLKSYQNMVKQYINLHIDKIRRRYVNPTKEEVAERTRLTIDLEQLKKELQK